MRYRPLDILFEKPVVEGDRFCKLLDSAVGLGVEAAAPGFPSHNGHSGPAGYSLRKHAAWLTQSKHAVRRLSIIVAIDG
jgi:hypothetical protein